jgi:protein CpxP
MNKNKWMTMGAVLALTASIALAGPRGEGKGHGKHGRGGGELGKHFDEKLSLTDAQKQQIREIKQSVREQNKAFFDSARATHEQFRDAKKAGDTARLDALKPQMEAQRTQMKQLREQEMQRVLSILTPEQRSKWDALKAERAAKKSERGERRNQK